MMTLEDKLKYFEREISYIQDPYYIKLIKLVFDRTGEWFFHDPASSTGKNHPKFAQGDGGLVRHTQAVVYWVKQLLETKVFVSSDCSDQVITAAILHDVCKHDDKGNYLENHAQAAADLIEKISQNQPDLSDRRFKISTIADMVRYHMGIWDKNPRIAETISGPGYNIFKILHIADFIASRKEYELNIW